MTAQRRVGVLGGTFDPVHFGHLGAALAARQTLSLDRVLLVPSAFPPHRPEAPEASGPHRLAMVTLAIDGIDGLEASEMELGRDGPSFTATTLSALNAQGFDRRELHFVTGADAFAEIATWHDYPAVLDLAHFVVIARTGHDLSDIRRRLPELALRMRTLPGARGSTAADRDTGEAHALGEPGDPAIWLVEATTPDVSSTQIRDRIRGRLPLTGLVPPLVERYIHRHGLYRPLQAVAGDGHEKTHA